MQGWRSRVQGIELRFLQFGASRSGFGGLGFISGLKMQEAVPNLQFQ